MDRYEGPLTDLTKALNRCLYLAIIMNRYYGPLTALKIALHGGLLLAIIMDLIKGPSLPLLKPCIEAST
jgi:hypothetical protein